MAELEFTRQDIVSLIEKVSTLQPHFSAQELRLLMSIFGLAAQHAVPADELETAILPEAAAPGQQTEGSGPATVDELRQQLLQAYIPGSSFDNVTEDAEVAVSYSIHRHSIHRSAGSHSIHRDVLPPEEG